MPNKIAMNARWQFDAYAPVQVADCDKLQSLLASEPAAAIVPFDYCREHGFLHAKTVNRLLPQLSNAVRASVEALLSGGEKLWADVNDNRIVNTGLDDILDKFFRGSAYTAAHYVGLTSTAPTTVATNTMVLASRSWTEVVAYSEATRELYVPDAVSGQSINNTTTKASFSINQNATTVGGGFLATGSAKGEVASTLISVDAFANGDQVLSNGSTLEVQINYSLADA